VYSVELLRCVREIGDAGSAVPLWRVRRGVLKIPVRPPNQISLPGETVEARRDAPPNSLKCATEQCEWVLDASPDGKVDFDHVAGEFEAPFGFHRSAEAIRQFIQKTLGWRASTNTWTIHQRRWIVRSAKEGTLWRHMVQPFNNKFKAARTSDELKSQYEEILRYPDPTIPDEDRPEWAKHSEFEKFGIMISRLRGNRVHVGTGPWTQEQDDVLRERRAEKVP
jgi:hypothetical protein